MSFQPGDFVPYPVCAPRPETPPPELDINHPFTGIELIVSGLSRASLTAPIKHLNKIIDDLVAGGHRMPELDIVSPVTTEPLDYVYISLAGPLKETPRPDILEDVRIALDDVDGISADWRASNSRTDLRRQVYFQAEKTTNLTIFKAGLDQALDRRRLLYQSSWVFSQNHRIFYLFRDHSAVAELQDRSLDVKRHSYHLRRPRLIQPRYGLEVAVNGVGGFPQAKTLINRHLEEKYGGDSNEQVVRDSRLELEGSVYCAILRTPKITSQFLSDPFTLFSNCGTYVSPSEYLYILNSKGIPNSVAPSNPSTFPQEPNPYIQKQLDTLTANAQSFQASLQTVLEDNKNIREENRQFRTDITIALKDTAAMCLTYALNSAQCDISVLQSSLERHEDQLYSLSADNPRFNYIQKRIATTQRNLNDATARRSELLRQLQAQHLVLPSPPPANIGTSLATTASPQPPPVPTLPTEDERAQSTSVPSKRPRRDPSNVELEEQREVEQLMKIDEN